MPSVPGFADSFWTPDYAGGLGVLFGKLQQGVIENQQLLTIARLRAEAEEQYGQRLGDIAPAVDKLSTNGFSRDDGASVRKAYEGVRSEMIEASRNHRKIASNIRELVVNPFTRWCDAHSNRVQNSHDELQARLKLHDKQAETVRKLRSHYFNKCRLVEDLEEEDKLAFKDPSAVETSPKPKIPEIKVQENKDEVEDSDEEEEPVEIGDVIYSQDQLKKILTHMLSNVTLGETKVPILGTYTNVTSGAEIVDYLQKHMGATTTSHAERIGQDMVSNGFLRLVGNMGNEFTNSSKWFYQWRPKVFQLTGVPEKKKPMNRTFSLASNADSVDSPVIGSVSEYLANWNPLNNPYPNETPSERLRREATEADEKYKAAVRKLDLLRCQLEEAMVEHFKFMERCELDRLKALKAVILDFSGALSNVIPSLQSTVDNMMLYQETIQPAGDLRYMLENYRTGGFAPKVQVYDNYYNTADQETFGVDLEARARADKKRVPIIVTSILTFLDNHYPDLEGDEARRGVWLVDVPLAATHHLRSAINNGKPVSPQALERYEVPIVASALKLYLRELPDSIVSSHVYEIMRTIYTSTTSDSTDDETRITVLQNTLGQLRLTNIATLDALMTHFTRLIELTSADEEFISTLAQSLAPCILRPRIENALTMEDKHPYRLVRDLFAHKEPIFAELKRASALNHSSSIRPRAISTDESNRKTNMEARNRAIAAAGGSRSRATSPAPSPRGHRRDRSSGGPETRFPISVSSPTGSSERNSRGSLNNVARQSLEVPGANDVVEPGPMTAPLQQTSNGTPAPESPKAETVDDLAAGVEKRNSLGRSAHVTSSNRFSQTRKTMGLARQVVDKRDSLSSIGQSDSESRPVGVSLTDKPMDD